MLIKAAASVMTFGTAAAIAEDPADTKLRDLVFSIDEAQFKPVADNPLYLPGEARISHATVWTDPATGRSSYLLKWTKGRIKRHYHTFNYQLVVLKGVMTHWTEALPQAGTKSLGVGSSYFQVARGEHWEACLTEECISLSTTFESGDTQVAPELPAAKTK